MSKNKDKPSKFRKGIVTSALCAGLIFGVGGVLAGCSSDPITPPEWFSGNGAPTAQTAGNVGDMYIDKTAYTLYTKKGEGWVKIADNFGKPGTPGQSETGNPGARGDTIFYGEGEPGASSALTGVSVQEGDLYLDTVGQVLWERKATLWAVKIYDFGESGEPGAPADTIEEIRASYEWGQDGKLYYVLTIDYTVGEDQVIKSLVPIKVANIVLDTARDGKVYMQKLVEEDNTLGNQLSMQVTIEDKEATTSKVFLTADMIKKAESLGSTGSDFTPFAAGTYKVDIYYQGFILKDQEITVYNEGQAPKIGQTLSVTNVVLPHNGTAIDTASEKYLTTIRNIFLVNEFADGSTTPGTANIASYNFDWSNFSSTAPFEVTINNGQQGSSRKEFTLNVLPFQGDDSLFMSNSNYLGSVQYQATAIEYMGVNKIYKQTTGYALPPFQEAVFQTTFTADSQPSFVRITKNTAYDGGTSENAVIFEESDGAGGFTTLNTDYDRLAVEAAGGVTPKVVYMKINGIAVSNTLNYYIYDDATSTTTHKISLVGANQWQQTYYYMKASATEPETVDVKVVRTIAEGVTFEETITVDMSSNDVLYKYVEGQDFSILNRLEENFFTTFGENKKFWVELNNNKAVLSEITIWTDEMNVQAAGLANFNTPGEMNPYEDFVTIASTGAALEEADLKSAISTAAGDRLLYIRYFGQVSLSEFTFAQILASDEFTIDLNGFDSTNVSGVQTIKVTHKNITFELKIGVEFPTE